MMLLVRLIKSRYALPDASVPMVSTAFVRALSRMRVNASKLEHALVMGDPHAAAEAVAFDEKLAADGLKRLANVYAESYRRTLREKPGVVKKFDFEDAFRNVDLPGRVYAETLGSTLITNIDDETRKASG